MRHMLIIAFREKIVAPEAIQFCKPFGNIGGSGFLAG
jgi:hypothetical protein